MAHLAIAPRTKFDALVRMFKDYHAQLDASSDVFEKAELSGFIHEIEWFCVSRGGREYLDRVRAAAIGSGSLSYIY